MFEGFAAILQIALDGPFAFIGTLIILGVFLSVLKILVLGAVAITATILGRPQPDIE